VTRAFRNSSPHLWRVTLQFERFPPLIVSPLIPPIHLPSRPVRRLHDNLTCVTSSQAFERQLVDIAASHHRFELPFNFLRGRRKRDAGYETTQARILELELLLLRGRLDVHFIFNALNTATGEAERPAEMLRVVEGLVGYLTYSLSAGDRLMVPFGDELDAVASYLVVEKARFGEAIEIRFSADAACRSVMVPGIFLQPLVENAIKHGRKTEQAILRLDIEASCENRVFLLRVTNSGRWVAPAPHLASPAAAPRPGMPGGWGDEIVRRCLELLYPGRHHFRHRAMDAGVVAEISIREPELLAAAPPWSGGAEEPPTAGPPARPDPRT
jgi:LytS/YehU family sensor histidine kinase